MHMHMTRLSGSRAGAAHRLLSAAIAGLALAAGACDDEDDALTGTAAPRTFTVRVEAVSAPNTLSTTRASGTIPLSPGAYAVFRGTDPMFAVGARADAGTERIAEDGFPMTKVASLAAVTGVRGGLFESPGGPDNGPALFAGESATFTVTASPGDRLQLQTMFVQSNDWFYAFGEGGLALFDGATPLSGNVTARLVLYDAGSEEDTAPGTGAFQKPVQEPTATNVGPADNDTAIRLASTTGFAAPPAASVIRVTVTPQP